MKYKNIVFVTGDPIKNMGNFRSYLIDNTDNLVTFHFSHGYSNKPSFMERFSKGIKTERKDFYQFKINSNILKLLSYYAYLSYILFVYGNKKSFVIVEKPFFLILNSIFSKLKGFKYVYWIGDYYPNSEGFMAVYNKLARYYNENLKYVVYESPPVEVVYKNMIPPNLLKNKFRRLITLGMKEKLLDKKNKEKKKIVLGFIGIIREQQGLDLAYKFLKENNNCILEVVGSGYKLDHYKKLAKKMKLDKKIKFLGFVEDLEETIKGWDMGLALYENTDDNLSIYCEPTKIKDYLEFGLPVITTKTTYFYKEVAGLKAGMAIEETIDELDTAIKKIMDNYEVYKKGVKKLVKKYEYSSWYDRHWDFLKKT